MTTDCDARVREIRARRPGFGGGYGWGGDRGHGEFAWYDAEIYPGDTYPVLPRAVFDRLAGGVLVGPGWRVYRAAEEADADAARAMGGGQ